MLLKNRHQWPTFPFFLGSWETLSFSTHEKGKKAGWDEEKSYVSLPPLIVYATLGMGTGVLQAAAPGFVGLGAQPPTPEWGAMLSEGRQYIQLAPHVAGFPGPAIFILVLGFNHLWRWLEGHPGPQFAISRFSSVEPEDHWAIEWREKGGF